MAIYKALFVAVPAIGTRQATDTEYLEQLEVTITQQQYEDIRDRGDRLDSLRVRLPSPTHVNADHWRLHHAAVGDHPTKEPELFIRTTLTKRVVTV